MRRTGFALLLLTACSRQPDYDDTTELNGKDAKAANAVAADVATNGVAAAAAKGLPVSKPGLTRAPRNALPTAFQGYWGMTPADCDLANAAATGRIDVEGDTIRFYESKARVAKLIAGDDPSVVADLTFTGEGQHWTRRTEFALGAGGTRLLRREQGQANTITYQRC